MQRSKDQIEEIVRLFHEMPQGTSYKSAGRSLGVEEKALKRYVSGWRPHGDQPVEAPLLEQAGLQVTLPPEENFTVEDMIALKKKIFRGLQDQKNYARLIPVKVKKEGAIAITLVGDPHVDDDGCDIEALERDLETATATDGMFLGHIGDLTNNWIGRLGRLYAHQMMTMKQAKALLDWVLVGRPNAFVVNGNHDNWQNTDIINYALQSSSTPHGDHACRLGLQFSTGLEIRIHARHDFSGKSADHPTHGMRKELKYGHRDHILVCGHTHEDAYEMIHNPSEDIVTHMSRVSGYKVIDDYQAENGFQECKFNASVTYVINPAARKQADLCKPFWDIEEAADYLKFKRGVRC
jgi:hypothetical protein